jgi:ankyrin repeat protein
MTADLERRLFEAIARDDMAKVSELLEAGASIDAFDSQGNTPLVVAGLKGSIEMVRFLLDRGADPNASCEERYVETFGAEETIELIGHQDGARALMKIADTMFLPGQDEIIRRLVKSGADVNAQDTCGRTALIYAVLAGIGLPQTVKTLLELGADPDLRDNDGVTALMFAIVGMDDPIAGESMKEIAMILRDAGASEEGVIYIILAKAAAGGDLKSVRECIAQGADVNFQASRPLVSAVQGGHLAVVRELLAAGANPNLRAGPRDLTALIHAASEGRLDVVQELMEAGADPKTSVPEPGTAIDYARQYGNRDVAKYLKEIGVNECDYAEARGVTTFQINEIALLVRAPVDRTAEAFTKLRGARAWIPDIYEKPVTPTELCFIIFQFSGHAWSLVELLHDDREGGSLSASDALELSRDLQTKVIFYENLDTSGSIAYALCERGEEMEAFSCGPGTLKNGLAPIFRSKHRDARTLACGEHYSFVEDFIKSQDAFLPGWSELSRTEEPGSEITIEGFPQNAIHRMDLIQIR